MADMMKSSLDTDEVLADLVQKEGTTRVTLEHIQRQVDTIEYHNPEVAPHMTVAYVRLVNGFVVLGTSAPADPENFDVAIGRKFAADDAYRKVWELEGYQLCTALKAMEG